MHKNSYKRRFFTLLSLLVLFTLIAAACGTDSDVASAETSAGVPGDLGAGLESGGLEGDFLVSGSSTVFPIVLRQAEQFGAVNGGVAIAVEGPGSGDGARKFCGGEVPIANASRLYKDEEVAICEANGIEFIELRRGIDGISVITSADNDVVECVSFNDLYALVSEDAFGFGDWSDANGLTALWGGTVFAGGVLDIFGPGEESGTYDSFGEIVIESVAKGKTGLDVGAREFVKTIRPDYTASANDTVILQGIGSSRYSLGWVGYAFAQEAVDAGEAKMLQVSFDDTGPCVTPTPETIADASFPISRFLPPRTIPRWPRSSTTCSATPASNRSPPSATSTSHPRTRPGHRRSGATG